MTGILLTREASERQRRSHVKKTQAETGVVPPQPGTQVSPKLREARKDSLDPSEGSWPC